MSRTKYFTSRRRNVLQFGAVGLDVVMMVGLVRGAIYTSHQCQWHAVVQFCNSDCGTADIQIDPETKCLS